MSESCQLLSKFQESWSLKVLGMSTGGGLGGQQGTGWLSAAFWHQGFRPETIARGSTRKEAGALSTAPPPLPFFLPLLPLPPSLLAPTGPAAAGSMNTLWVLTHQPQGPVPPSAAWLLHLPIPLDTWPWSPRLGRQQPSVDIA